MQLLTGSSLAVRINSIEPTLLFCCDANGRRVMETTLALKSILNLDRSEGALFALWSAIDRLSGHFADGNQHDPAEFKLRLIAQIRDELEKANTMHGRPTIGDPILDGTLGLIVRETIVCGDCHRLTSQTQRESCLKVNLPPRGH
eukprot:4212899-Prymnesium_polylepis.1